MLGSKVSSSWRNIIDWSFWIIFSNYPISTFMSLFYLIKRRNSSSKAALILCWIWEIELSCSLESSFRMFSSSFLWSHLRAFILCLRVIMAISYKSPFFLRAEISFFCSLSWSWRVRVRRCSTFCFRKRLIIISSSELELRDGASMKVSMNNLRLSTTISLN